MVFDFIESCDKFCSPLLLCDYISAGEGRVFEGKCSVSIEHAACGFAQAVYQQKGLLPDCIARPGILKFQEFLNHEVDFPLGSTLAASLESAAPLVLRIALVIGAFALLRFATTPRRLGVFETPWD